MKTFAERAARSLVLLLAVFVATLICVDAGAGQMALPLVVSRAGSAPVVHHGLVTDVIDGDTIEVQVDGLGLPLRVRYIGIDTPDRGACFRAEAKGRNEQLVRSKRVRLEWDKSARDRRLRYLCYVHVDGVMVNEVLVREGFALAYTYPPDVRHARELVQLEEVARDRGLGLWGECVPPKSQPPPEPSRERPVSLTYIKYCGLDEYVRVTNRFSESVTLVGWTIVSATGGQVYAIPAQTTLGPYESLYIHSGEDAEERDPWHLLWRRGYVWNDTGDTVQLVDGKGRLVDEWQYTSPDGCDGD